MLTIAIVMTQTSHASLAPRLFALLAWASFYGTVKNESGVTDVEMLSASVVMLMSWLSVVALVVFLFIGMIKVMSGRMC